MSRVHGDKIIRRRTDYVRQSDIQKYSSNLKEDFHNMCGYCGKDFNIISCPHQKDHLIPEKEAKKYGRNDLLISYENLVYACRVCNRNKWDHWPLDNIDRLNDGVKGYVDPASAEFDKHLYRNEQGEIIAKSKVGEYMYSILNFENRLTSIWWKMSQIETTIQEIDELLEHNETLENLQTYRNLHNKYKSFRQLLISEKEMI